MDKAKNQDDQDEEERDENEDDEKEDDEKDYDKMENDNRLLAVSKYQSSLDEHTCVVPINPESHVIINDSKRKVNKKTSENNNETMEVAPGEGVTPTNFLRTEHFDEKSSPMLHPTGQYGIDHPREMKLSPQVYMNQRMFNADPRFSLNIPWVFSFQQLCERNSLERQCNISGQKGVPVSCGGGKTQVKVNDMCNIFQKIKGTPKYWQLYKNEMIAKVKQLGPFHIFFTLSCAEMRWSEVMVSVLKRSGYDVIYEEDENGWNGDDDTITVNGEKIWDFVDKLETSKSEMMREYI